MNPYFNHSSTRSTRSKMIMVEFLRSIFKEDRFNQLSDTFDNFYYNYILPEVIEIQAFNIKI